MALQCCLRLWGAESEAVGRKRRLEKCGEERGAGDGADWWSTVREAEGKVVGKRRVRGGGLSS